MLILCQSFDTNGNGFLSLAEVDRGILQVLNCRDIYNIKPVLLRAFQAAKNLSTFLPLVQHDPCR
jgi:hypothetical protein